MTTNVVITGGSSGLGKAICKALPHDWNIIDWSLNLGVDVRDASSIDDAIAELHLLSNEKLDILINCAGINFIQYLPQMRELHWEMVMDTNAKGIYLVTQGLLRHLKDGTVLNIISNASHVPMTCSIAYNASKAAAAIMTKQMARELGKTHNITVFGISPNKLKGTGMSQYIDERVRELRNWTKEEATQYQLASLPAGEETDPETLAEFIAFLLSSKQRHKYLAGCDIPYGGP